MNALLFQVVSGLFAALAFAALVRPCWFRFLVDKGSGMPSLGKQGQYVALLTSTWAFAALTLSSNLTEWFMGIYSMCWAGAAFGSLWLQIKGAAQGVTTTHTSTTSSSSERSQP